MRTTFIEKLTEMAASDPRVTLVTGDLGFGVVQQFAERFPNQFLNAGVAEQNMTGIAAGMALSGRIVFTYSIANFPTLRPLEQIRNDVCYHNANVTVVAVGGGLAYGALGMSHHATEDLAILRSLPGINVIAPGDPVETAAAVEAVGRGIGPTYLRLGRAGEPTVHAGPIDWRLGKAIEVRGGSDLTLISTGGMLKTAVDVSRALADRHGLGARVLSMHTIKPLDSQAIVNAAAETGALFTIEEHSVTGGLGAAAAEVLCESGVAARFRRIGLPSACLPAIGSQPYLLKQFGLDAAAITERVASEMAAPHAKAGPAVKADPVGKAA